jgi:hypothetical protein
VDVSAALVPDGDAAELREPSQGALDLPAVPPELLAAVDAAARGGRDRPGGALMGTAEAAA